MAKSFTNHEIGKWKRMLPEWKRKQKNVRSLERWLQTLKTWHRRGQREGAKAAADKLVASAKKLDKRARFYGERGMHDQAEPFRLMAAGFRQAADHIMTGSMPS